MRIRNFLVILCLLLLAACERTTLEAVPVTESACDKALSGHWRSHDDDPEQDGELELQIDADCTLAVIARGNDVAATGPSTNLHLGKVGDTSLLWVNAHWLHTRFAMKEATMPSENYLYRYLLEGADLQLFAPAHRRIAHRIIDGDLPGAVDKHGDDLHNRLGTSLQATALTDAQFFNAEALRFIRETEHPHD